MATHRFAPERYYVTIGSHPIALTIVDGDTVTTTTVDAAGRDQHGERVSEPGNPMTGPFYIEGAEPGDTLAVRLDRLRPNRTEGIASTVVAENVVDPDFVRKLSDYVTACSWPVRTS